MVINRWNPWNEVFSAHEQLYTDALGRTLMPERLMHTLPLDIRQSDDAFEIEASVPGFKPEDVDITFDENVLTIRGTRHEDEVMRGAYVRRERNAHSVYRQVGLPAEVKTDEITAGFDNGVLTVIVPRAQRAQPKRIPVIATVEHPKLIESGADAPVAV
ncbi:MAG: Hsp20/alpha crystallin family protein [Chloroflexi bacterium]|nr:MAG: Hsp20/alpha crystallin family protein [Chloroflexota bacterium]TMF14736.1 MAG: Hsp20/alpha crystallin family protein [Chloroflexota bacterium]